MNLHLKQLAYFIIFLSICTIANAQDKERHDKGQMIEYKNPFWEEIDKSVKEFDAGNAKKDEKKQFKMDFSGWDLPKSLGEFKSQWHNQPLSQGSTGTCWSFSATSFLESEAKRINNLEIKLSELFTVYWQYVEKARRYVRERGNSVFAEGSQANAVTEMWKKYGCVPAEAYTGLINGRKFHGHGKMFEEMKSYLEFIKKNNVWNENEVINNIKSILNYYLGEPPTEFEYKGKKYTPNQFLTDYVKINPNDYVPVLSLMQQIFWTKTEYPVEDNWWHSSEYYNVPVEDFMNALKKAVKSGYTVVLSGDVSESGINSFQDAAVVPSYDIPSKYIDDYARQFRFSNGSTADDHGIHLVGYTEKDGEDWFLIKDSGSGAQNGKFKGYYIFHSDYIKLKILGFFVHKSAVNEIINKIDKEK